MSKAFIKEGEDYLRPSNPLPDRPIPAAPNLVTPDGLAKIEEIIHRLEEEQREARVSGNADALDRAARDLRYWSAQRASARVMEPPAAGSEVQFGSTVLVERADGQHEDLSNCRHRRGRSQRGNDLAHITSSESPSV